jgi:hypothetical protein
MSTLASDNFNRADENPLSGSGVWSTYSANDPLALVSNQVRGTVVGGTVDGLETHTVSLPNDQWSQATLVALGASYSEVGVMLRFAAPNTESGYFFTVYDAGAGVHGHIVKVTATVQVGLTDFAMTLIGNDVIRLEAIGTALTAYQNGAQVSTTTDGDFGSGRAGLFFYTQSPLANTKLDDFSCGDFVSGIPRLRMAPYRAA